MDGFCGKCDRGFSRDDNQLVPCNGFCKKLFHRKCCEGQLSEYDVTLLKKNRNLGYYCNDCVFMPKKIIEQYEILLNASRSKHDCIAELLNQNVNMVMEMQKEFKFEMSKLCERDNNSQLNERVESMSESIKDLKEISSSIIVSERDKNLKESVKHISKSVNDLKQEIKKNNNKGLTLVEKRKSENLYSDMLKKTEPSVLVFPKKKQEANETRKQIKQNIDPTSININNVVNKNSGGIAIKCGDKDSSEKLKNEIEAKLKDDYEVIMPKMIKPKVCIMNIENDETENEIVDKIKKQNMELSNCDLKLVNTFRNKNKWRNLNAVLEMDSDSFNKIMKLEKIKVGWVKCFVREYFNLRRCFKCQGFNHKASVCKNKVACSKCGGEHSIKDCKIDQVKCVNCCKMNINLGMNVECDHEASDKCCPVFLRKLKVFKERILY